MYLITLKNIICRHIIKSPDSRTYTVVFMDPRDHETYVYFTDNSNNWKVGDTYSIKAKTYYNRNEGAYLYGVEKLRLPQNALDILVPDTRLTNDEKYSMLLTHSKIDFKAH